MKVEPGVRLDLASLVIRALNPEELVQTLRLSPTRASSNLLQTNSDATLISSTSRTKLADAPVFELSECQRLAKSLFTNEVVPAWVRLLRGFFEHRIASKSCYQPGLSIAENLAAPMAAYAAELFLATHRKQITAILSAPARRALQASLRSRLAATGKFAAQRAWQVFCATPGAGNAKKSSVQRKLKDRYFARDPKHRTRFLLYANPALARLWAVQSELWLNASSEFVTHGAELIGKLKPRSVHERFRIEKVRTDQSDLHRGNRSVIYVSLSNKSEWYYKPRSGSPEAFWNELLRTIIAPLGYSFRTPKLIKGENHFWMESVSPLPCTSKAEAGKFFRKAGVIAYLLHWLRGVDFHAGNLIADGSNPVLVDCETLFHPPLEASLQNVRATGFFPISDQWEGVTDSMSALGRITLGAHSVRVGDRRVVASEFCEELLTGFKMLRQSARGITAQQVRDLARASAFRCCRHLFRSTGEYGAMLDSSLRTKILRNSVTRSSYLHSLCAWGNNSSSRIRAEAAALEQGDIPLFYGPASRVRGITQKQMWRAHKDLRHSCKQLAARMRRVRVT